MTTIASRSASRRPWPLGHDAPTSNAYYNPLLNEIVFPAGILQPPAFDVAATDAVNYGAIGVVHWAPNFSHGFDDQGAQFDCPGQLEQLVDARGQGKIPDARPMCR